jgi:hypothetical protein
MDRLTALFEQFSLPEIERLMRRTVFASIGFGVVAFGVSLVLSHVLAGLGIVVGLGIGLVNIRLVTRSVARVTERQPARPNRVLAGSAVGRLAATTVVVIGLAVASVALGIGAAGGIAVFYLLLVVNLVVSLLHQAPGAPA